MSSGILIALDLVVIFCLSLTIPYMFSLMKSIKEIKSGKTDLQRLVAELSASINKADNALTEMKKSIDGKGKELDKMLHQASSVIDEMTFINKASDNLAERLGRLVFEGGKLIDDRDDSYGRDTVRKQEKTAEPKKKSDKTPHKKSSADEEILSDDVLRRLEESLARHGDLEKEFDISEYNEPGFPAEGMSRSERELAGMLRNKK